MPPMTWDFQAQLARYGPDSGAAPPSRATAQMYCSWLGRTHYENFSVATLELANFWQDVARALDSGRVYVPEEDRPRFGYDDEALGARLYTPAFIEMRRFAVERTRERFYRGCPLVERMPSAMRGSVELL